MGVTYYAETYLGVEVTEADLIEEVVETWEEVNCDHPDTGAKFCPECGTSRKKRTVTHTKTVKKWKVSAVGESFDEDEEPSLHNLAYYEVVLNGFQFVRISDHYSDLQLLYGVKIASNGSNGYTDGPNPHTVPFAGLAERVKVLEGAIKELGIDQPVRHYTLLRAS